MYGSWLVQLYCQNHLSRSLFQSGWYFFEEYPRRFSFIHHSFPPPTRPPSQLTSLHLSITKETLISSYASRLIFYLFIYPFIWISVINFCSSKYFIKMLFATNYLQPNHTEGRRKKTTLKTRFIKTGQNGGIFLKEILFCFISIFTIFFSFNSKSEKGLLNKSLKNRSNKK